MSYSKINSALLPGFKEGCLLVLSPLPLLFSGWRSESVFPYLPAECCAAILCSFSLAWCAFSLCFRRRTARVAGIAALVFAGLALFPEIIRSPLTALLYLVSGIWGIRILWEESGKKVLEQDFPAIRIRRASGGCAGVFLLLLFFTLTGKAADRFFQPPVGRPDLKSELLLASCLIFLCLYGVAGRHHIGKWKHAIWSWCFFSFLLLVLAAAFRLTFLQPAVFLVILPMIPRMALTLIGTERFAVDTILTHPLQLLLTTFLLLCLSGTLLLRMPGAAENSISLLDAAFTAVSAVCVTGLVVLDTGKDFTPLGQFFILLLIQLGGLGIMSIASAAMYSLGKRISLNQESVMNSLTDTGSGGDLRHALLLILKYTFLMETTGAAILSLAFRLTGENWLRACGEGIFTAVSAFCNAGFSLRSGNLTVFQNSPLILYTVLFLIIAGGLPPAVAVFLPSWLRRKRVPLFAHLIFSVTGILLVGAFIGILVLEWNGVLGGLSLAGKINNAWFQSATLRTAGFNSVDLEPLQASTLLLMCFMMAAGGSPGGTAGGFKTMVLGILFLTFWNRIRNQDQVICRDRRIPDSAVLQSVTILAAYSLLLALSIFMLLQTQFLPARKLIFEAFSALGTVGLSLNTTPHLDEIGRVIVILTMFAGRIGPVSLFMLLNGPPVSSKTHYPEMKIPLN